MQSYVFCNKQTSIPSYLIIKIPFVQSKCFVTAKYYIKKVRTYLNYS